MTDERGQYQRGRSERQERLGQSSSELRQPQLSSERAPEQRDAPVQLATDSAASVGHVMREQMAHTLPRHFDPVTLQASKQNQRRAALPQFPNPHPSQSGPTNPVQQGLAVAYGPGLPAASQPALRHKHPFFVPAQVPPPTPPLALPAAVTYSTSRPAPQQVFRPSDAKTHARRPGQGKSGDRDDAEDDEKEERPDTRWSSDESTPTPTASSVAAASARRREEAKTMLPITLVTPSQATRPQATFQSGQQADVRISSTMKGKGVADPRPLSSSSFSMPDGRQVPVVRTDFENMKRISRPVSSSKASTPTTAAAAMGSSSIIPSKEKAKEDSAPAEASLQVPEMTKQTLPQLSASSPLSASAPLPTTPSVPHVAQFGGGEASKAADTPSTRSGSVPQRSNLVALQEYRPHQIEPVQEEDEQQHAQSTGDRAAAQVEVDDPATDRARRRSVAASLHRHSFESGTTALDTPRLDDEGRTSFEMVGTNGQPSGILVSNPDLLRPSGHSRKGLVSGAAAPPSDIPEVVESASGEPARAQTGREGTPRSQGLSAHLEQLHRFIHNAGSRSDNGKAAHQEGTVSKTTAQQASGQTVPAANPETDKSLYSHIIPITGVTRPRTGNSNRNRPGTAQTRFSLEAPRSIQRRRLGSAGGLRPRTMGHEALQQMLHDPQAHTHDRPTCRQCFRAGFDCAIQLQNGHGTGARKALQEFVAAGGLEALSGVDDFYEGSVWGSQAAGNAARQSAAITGQNFVDKLGEVAFGESALSRPVTRGAVQDMLEERSRLLAERQHSKTVEDFLFELQRLQKEQEDEMALKETDAEYERSASGLQRGQSMSNSKTTDQQNPLSPRSAATAFRTAQSMGQPVGSTQAFEDGKASQQDVMPGQEGNHVSERQPSEDRETMLDDRRSDRQSQGSNETDDLPFLADRWSIERKLCQLTVCALWIFCVQCISAGFITSIPAIAKSTGADAFSLEAGQLSFLLGQGGGLLLGPTLSCRRRYRAPPITVVIFSAVCVAIGFMRSGPVLTTLRGVLGSFGGMFEMVVVGMVLDMSTTRRQRLCFFAYLIVFVLAAQAAGPWIAKIVIKFGTWSWLYWLAAIFGIPYVVIFGSLAQETEPCSIYRTSVQRLRMHSRDVWTPEPRPMPSMKQIMVYRPLRPWSVFLRHALVTLSTILVAVTMGGAVGVLAPLASTLSLLHHFENWQADLLISLSVAIGLCVGVASVFLFALRPVRQLGEMKSSSQRARVLFMDEKGIIDAQRPSFDPEKMLHIAAAGLIACIVGLYTLALTTTTTSWIFSAISLTLIVAGTTILAVGLMQYLSEAYFPASQTKLGELLALSDHLGPAPRLAGADNARPASQLDDESLQDDHTLMSGANEDGKRWDSSWALSVLSVVLAVSLYVCGAMSLLGQLGALHLGFQLFAAIVASIVLGLAGLMIVLLIGFGAPLRRQAFAHIAKTEQKLWQSERASGSAVAASVRTSTGTILSRRSPLERGIADEQRGRQESQRAPGWKGGLRQLLLPTARLQREQQSDVESRRASATRDHAPRRTFWPWRRRSSSAVHAAGSRPLTISAPFGVQHIASGGADFQALGPATPVETRRRTLVDPTASQIKDLYHDKEALREWAAYAQTPAPVHLDRAGRQTSTRRHHDERNSRSYHRTKTPSPTASPRAPLSPQMHGSKQEQSARNAGQRSPEPQMTHVQHVDGQAAAQQARTIWSGHVRQSSMGGVDQSPGKA